MDCIAIMDSGNYALKLCDLLEKKGYVFEVVSTPCHIARNGCSYCLRFPLQFRELVLQEAEKNRMAVREMFKVIPRMTRNIYERI